MKYIWICLVAVLTSYGRAESPARPAFQFKHPEIRVYDVDESALRPEPQRQWINARPRGGTQGIQFGSRIVMQTIPGSDLHAMLAGRELRLTRVLAPNVFLLQAPDVWIALREAQDIARRPDVVASYPVTRRLPRLHGPYAAKPNDPYFARQFYLEQRNTNGMVLGADLNVRAAWPYSRGDGVAIGVADDGIELTHPDLQSRVAGMPHFNFITGTSDGSPASSYDMHATAVAGLIAAEAQNGQGISGVAPGAHMASWKIFNGDPRAAQQFPDEIQMMDMFQYRTEIIGVQNHSWGYGGTQQLGPTLSEKIGISNAVTSGRGGRGVVMVRSAGNDRVGGGNANDDGYTSDHRVITVAAIRSDGRATKYSNPGACILVAAPSGETLDDGFSPDLTFPTLFTTDRQGVNEGYDPSADYCGDANGFSGTSGSAPQISGLVALLLSANTNLTYRDVQQILLQSARHVDLQDPGMTTNGAGFRISHNVGFGIPDAGFAVDLARRWVNRRPMSAFTVTTNAALAIPDDGLKLVINDTNAPANTQSIPSTPGLGLHPDVPTPFVQIVDVGMATNPIPVNLSGKAALIQRGVNFFSQKIQFAADAGAAFAVVYNNTNATERIVMANTDFSPIPAVFIDQTDGEALRSYLQQTNPPAQLRLVTADYAFVVTNTLLCEHVAVRVQTDHPRRADVRITLTSPRGTRSVLQRLNYDVNSAGPVDWVYSSTHCFYESSAGAWLLSFSDESPGQTGSVQMAALTIYGTDIKDTDHDGLDDEWESAHFGSLTSDPTDDPDGDGSNNAREQILGTDPRAFDVPLKIDLSAWDSRLARLSWPGSTNFSYEVHRGNEITNVQTITNIPGRFPETEWFVPYENPPQQFFSVRRVWP